MASRSVNKVILIGHLGRDAETKFTPGGAAVTRFAVATNRRWKDQQSGEWKDETNWTNVVLWRAENLANYLTKGKQLYVEGRIQTRSYDDKDGKKVYATEVVADDVILLGGQEAVVAIAAAEAIPSSRFPCPAAPKAARARRPAAGRIQPGHHRRRRPVLTVAVLASNHLGSPVRNAGRPTRAPVSSTFRTRRHPDPLLHAGRHPRPPSKA